MSLFGFGDITFKKGSSLGPLGALNSSPYQSNIFRFPSDVGQPGNGHYVIFYAREQEKTSYKEKYASESGEKTLPGTAASMLNDNGNNQTNLTEAASSAISNAVPGAGGVISDIGNTIKGASQAIENLGNNAVAGVKNYFSSKGSSLSGSAGKTNAIVGENVASMMGGSFLKTTKRTSDAIALYMPDTLQYQHTQKYNDLSLGGSKIAQGIAAGAAGVDSYKESGNAGKAGSNALVAAALGIGGNVAKDALGDVGQFGFTAATGAVTNPMLEMVYTSPDFRSFQFDFSFYPRSETEGISVQKILERFKFHQAPEFYNLDGKNFVGALVPPSEFDIEFFYNGKINPNIPRIATCVLESIDIDYAPNRFNAYEVPGENEPKLGRTGMPVAINLRMSFRERTYLTKSDFKNPRLGNFNASSSTDN